MAAIFKENRDIETETDENKAKEDAQRLHEVEGYKFYKVIRSQIYLTVYFEKAKSFTWDGDDNVFSEVFNRRNFKQLQLTFNYFHDESGQDITELILQEFTFHLQKALLNIGKNVHILIVY